MVEVIFYGSGYRKEVRFYNTIIMVVIKMVVCKTQKQTPRLGGVLREFIIKAQAGGNGRRLRGGTVIVVA